MPAITPLQRLEYFYSYARRADVLKLDRTSGFILRKEMFEAAREMLRLARLHRAKAGFLKAAREFSLKFAKHSLPQGEF